MGIIRIGLDTAKHVFQAHGVDDQEQPVLRHAAEFGVVAAKGPVKVAELVQWAQAEAAGVPALALAREMLGVLAGQIDRLDGQLKALEAKLMAWHKADPVSQCLATQPGIGPISAVSFALKTPIRRASAPGATSPPGSA